MCSYGVFQRCTFPIQGSNQSINGMDQRDRQATENLLDLAYEAYSGRTDHRNTKQIAVLRHRAENEYREGVRLACGVNLLFSVRKIASFYQSDNDFPQSKDTRRSSHPQKLVLHGVSLNLTTPLSIDRPQAFERAAYSGLYSFPFIYLPR